MAEEFDIRSVWNKSKERQERSSPPLEKLERKGTRTTLYWIKTILWIEFWLSIIALPVMFIYFRDMEVSGWFTLSYFMITLIYLVYYQFLIRQIRTFSYDRNVLENLKKIHGYLRFYLLHYKVVFWLSLLCGFIYGMMDPENKDLLDKVDSLKQWIIMIIVWIVLFAIVGGLFHLFIYLIYGRKIKRLKKMIQELGSLD
ncbi:MAG: hypothetical protein RLN88_07915 [Ekhidna sp.]|uniref:hypothetical protein n=1 Tax=Ekhidna sp. TaxID=2608089 RepID=UPI0032EF8F1F